MTDLATRTPAQELATVVRSNEFQGQVALALPEGMSPSRFVRVMATALLDNPELATKGERNSIFQSGLKAAQDGLLPDGREAAFVLFGNACVYMPMIGGFRKIAAEHGWSLRTRVVYEADEFHHVLGVEETMTHVPVRPGIERGELVAAYAVATHKDGRREMEVVYKADVEKVRASSRAKNSGPWVDWPAQMWEKTAGRKLFKKLPLDERDRERIARVLDASELAPGEAAERLYGTPLPPASPSTTSDGERADSLSPESAASPEQAAAGRTDDAEPVAAASPEPEPEPVLGKPTEFKAPESVEKTPEVLAAEQAATVVIPQGENKGRPLKDLTEQGDKGVRWIRWCLRQWADDAFGRAAWDFARVYFPEVYEQVAAEKGREA